MCPGLHNPISQNYEHIQTQRTLSVQSTVEWRRGCEKVLWFSCRKLRGGADAGQFWEGNNTAGWDSPSLSPLSPDTNAVVGSTWVQGGKSPHFTARSPGKEKTRIAKTIVKKSQGIEFTLLDFNSSPKATGTMIVWYWWRVDTDQWNRAQKYFHTNMANCALTKGQWQFSREGPSYQKIVLEKLDICMPKI